MNYTYLLRCADGTLYCGWTNHLAARVAAHNAGKGAKYTKTRCPVVLAYYEEYATRSEAMRREAAIKKLTKKEKEAMAALGRTEFPVEDRAGSEYVRRIATNNSAKGKKQQ